ncbi:MAG: hypothetical protein ABA06_01295 [Parcubacteria bacterium C7867-001]|nr:MAG: hypothetical protein ABA06_01295 [Parcubacteria bacterium C7867-001]
MDGALKSFKKNAIFIALVGVVVLLGIYLSCDTFRNFLSEQGIDPNFIIGFLTIVALLLSLLQASHDRRYAYNLKLIESIEEKGLRIIGKLLGIKQKSAALLASLEAVKKCMDERVIFLDAHNVTDKADVDMDMELVTAYIHTYFNELGSSWNQLIDKLRGVGDYAGNAILNYKENIDVIQTHGPINVCDTLNKLPTSIQEARRLNAEIDVLTQSITDVIVKKISDTRLQVKASID